MFIILVFISQTESEKQENNLMTRTSKVMRNISNSLIWRNFIKLAN